MRKIKSQKDIEKIEKKKQMILTIILGFILLVSTIGFAFSNKQFNENTQEVRYYNGLSFVKGSSYWELRNSDNVFYFNYLPEELMDLECDLNKSINDYSGNVFYYVGNYNNRLFSNISPFVLRIQEAKITESELNVPQKNCSVDNILIFEQSNNSSIYMKDNCVYLIGDSSKLSDLFFYKLLGIM